MSRTESALPRRPRLRMESVDPSCRKSSVLSDEEQRSPSCTCRKSSRLIAEEQRAKLRRLRLLPMWRKSSTLIDEEHLGA